MIVYDFFCISPGKVATSDRWGGQICKNFLRISYAKKSLKSVHFWQSYSKNKRWVFLETQGILQVVRYFANNFEIWVNLFQTQQPTWLCLGPSRGALHTQDAKPAAERSRVAFHKPVAWTHDKYIAQ